MQKSDCIIGVEHVSKFFGDKAVLSTVMWIPFPADSNNVSRLPELS